MTFKTLSNGLEIPQLGIGTFNLPTNEKAKAAVLEALKNGYRHIDTAHAYFDEQGVGEAIRESGIKREEIWLTSKLWPSEYGEGTTLGAIDKMLARLQTEYLDLLYVHQPIGDYLGAWKDMEKAAKAGKVRALGISNFDFNDEMFQNILEHSEVKPAVLQIECHPYAQRIEMRKKASDSHIAVECWFPLGSANPGLLSDPVIAKIAKTHGKTVPQAILRWHMQEGLIAIPGSTNPAHIKENIEIFDFTLTDAEMDEIRGLNREQRFFTMSFEQTKAFVSGVTMTD